ncbi:MAG: pyridoxamine 5'-phosphate oxidase family protein [Geminicoccaceae bacterium]|nr:pyridoxamine 5'-phosphate oxidase family protein [Geminicoccaceae bacterium]
MNDLARTERTRIRRLHERGRYDIATARAILDAGWLCHIAYVIDGTPYATPTMYWREGDRVYWHGSSASKMLRGQKGGGEVCFTVTHVDALVLARSGFHHSARYRSLMLIGRPEMVEDEAEKDRMLGTFIDRLWPGRNAALRPPTPQELKATAIMGMDIDEGAAKISSGPPADDEEDYDLPVWAGLQPVITSFGEPVPCPRLKPGTALPDYLRSGD